MDTYGLILLIAMPVFVVLIITEIIAYTVIKKQYNYIDSVSSLYSGMTNTIKDVLGLTIVVISYEFLLKNLSIIHWKNTNAFTYILAFLILDFGGYWYHRISHTVNYFWNLHIIHHSSEEYNLPCALRQQFAVVTNLLFIFCLGILLALIGIPKEVFIIIAPIHLFMQFWYHTKLINKMGFLEKIIVTPSHHRVHHSMNAIYMDKNYSQIFIIWDKLFGTFQEELDTEPCIYGVRRPVRTWNPFLINTQHVWLIIQDSFRTKNILDKIKVWFMPTGWRPKDMEEKYPVLYLKADDVYHFERYNPTYSKGFQIWSQIHLTVMFVLMGFLFFNIKNLQSNNQYIYYGLFLLFSIFSYTTLMDKKILGVITECVNLLIVSYIVFSNQDWFGVNQFINNGHFLVLSFFVLETIAAIYFYFAEFKNEMKVQII
ncbi:MAG: sterol desaturase family protein [Sphingobacteriales bacterium]|nr:sterol desaturase family protein [Sphingobacteriales bacterium]